MVSWLPAYARSGTTHVHDCWYLYTLVHSLLGGAFTVCANFHTRKAKTFGFRLGLTSRQE